MNIERAHAMSEKRENHLLYIVHRGSEKVSMLKFLMLRYDEVISKNFPEKISLICILCFPSGFQPLKILKQKTPICQYIWALALQADQPDIRLQWKYRTNIVAVCSVSRILT